MSDNKQFGNSEQLEASHKKDHVADPGKMVGDLIGRAEAVETVRKAKSIGQAHRMLMQLPSAQPESKCEYHYDHTDCIWYRPEARNRCPSTCAQYRDGWNDAMNYIFRDGEGYRPFRRDKKYEG